MSQALPFLLTTSAVVAIPVVGYAQQAPSAAEASAALNNAPSFSQAQLDQMLAPIALYPDQVLMQVLMAATFPQQIVDAAQWLQNQGNANLHGDALASALQPLPWDPSVKSLVAFPQIIVMMNDHMDWTQSLGVAFANQQIQMMAEVQALRNRAASAGQFQSNGQIKYVDTGGVWEIDPVNPGEIYIPVYNPAVVYGNWAYPDYPPIYVPPPPGFVAAGFALGRGIGFSVGFGVVAPLWGWGHPDWRRHEFVIDEARYTRITTNNYVTNNHVVIRGGTWRRTAPVATVNVRAPTEPANAPHPEGTAVPAAVHAPPPRSGAPGAEHPAQAPGETHPALGQPPHPEEAHPVPGQPPHPEPEGTRPVAPPTEHAAPLAPRPEEHAPPPVPHPEEHAAPPAPRPEEHAPPPRPVEPPHPAPPPPPPHPAAPPPAAHPPAPPHPEAAKPEEPPK